MHFILALSAKSNSGKTTTLLSLGQLLSQIGFVVLPSARMVLGARGAHPDEWNVFESQDGARIGINTRGDNLEEVRQGFVYMNTYGCQYCICACRSYGETHNEIESIENFCKLYFPKKRDESNSKVEQDRLNNWDASQMLEVIKRLIP